MSCAEFERLIQQGEQLSVLDEYVLDITGLMNSHPGGRFTIENNVGRDISKFFHGGYTMENH